MDQPCAAAALDAWLAGRSAAAEETVVWSLDPPLQLRVDSYLAGELAPDACISSVRAVLLGAGAVLVVRDPEGVHILPGGRRENTETFEQTLVREIGEESGYRIGAPRLLGCSIFTHLTPKPPHYGYPYPRFAHAVYAASALDHRPELQQIGGYELEATWEPLEVVAALPLGPGQQLFLEAALRAV